jgi:hypothetical protein
VLALGVQQAEGGGDEAVHAEVAACGHLAQLEQIGINLCLARKRYI